MQSIWEVREIAEDPLNLGEFFLDRGYTGHEHLQLSSFGGDGGGIINMNGRVYDPVLARFLQPDNYVQLPDFTQSFNRYTYALNNPFKYTDPDGEFVWFVIGGAIIGSYIGEACSAYTARALWQSGVPSTIGFITPRLLHTEVFFQQNSYLFHL